MSATNTPLVPTESFLQQAEVLQIAFDKGDVEKLGAYLALLLETNKKFNLTSITDSEVAWMKHILDSLTLLPHVVSNECQSVIDVGSGGGLPGVPLAICLPDIQFTLLEATGKKAKFLQEVADTLQLSNVTVVNDRAETLGQDHKQFRERFDAAVARALGRLPVLLELAMPFVKMGGFVFAIKGDKASEELAESAHALRVLHGRALGTVETPTGVIVVIEKIKNTPRPYPRPPGEPKRNPL